MLSTKNEANVIRAHALCRREVEGMLQSIRDYRAWILIENAQICAERILFAFIYARRGTSTRLYGSSRWPRSS